MNRTDLFLEPCFIITSVCLLLLVLLKDISAIHKCHNSANRDHSVTMRTTRRSSEFKVVKEPHNIKDE